MNHPNTILSRLNTPLLATVIPYLHQDRFVFTEKEREGIDFVIKGLKVRFEGQNVLHPKFLNAVLALESVWLSLSTPHFVENGIALSEFDLLPFLGVSELLTMDGRLKDVAHPDVIETIKVLTKLFSESMIRLHGFLRQATMSTEESLDVALERIGRREWLRDWDIWGMCHVSSPNFFSAILPVLVDVRKIRITDGEKDALIGNYTGASLADIASFVKVNCYDNTMENGYDFTMAIHDVFIDKTDSAMLVVLMKNKSSKRWLF